MFYGHYTSFDQTMHFVTKAQEDLLFPPQVMYKNNSYRFIRAYSANTPKQLESFRRFCETQSCERDVELPK